MARLVVVLTFVTAGLAACHPPASAPNVLIINLDDGNLDALSVMPDLVGWMASGSQLTNMNVAIPSCCPSRSSLFTGRYPHNNGVRHQSDASLLDSEHTLARYLKSAGYRTAMSGKFLNSWNLGTAPPDFDRFVTIKDGYNNAWANINGQQSTLAGYSTTALGSRLRGFLSEFEATDSSPWFAYFAPQAPHIAGGFKTLATPESRYASTPVGSCAKPGESDRSDKPAYVRWFRPDPNYEKALCESQLRALMSVDDQVDLIMDQLRDDGELANTLVIFTSDNGNAWGEHGLSSKFTPYEPSVRVPFLMRWDGHVAAGIDSRLANLVDVLPTVLEAARIEPTLAPDGRSLLRPSTRNEVLLEYFFDAANGDFPTWTALRGPSYKYVENLTDGQPAFREYYDLSADPDELVNLLGDRNVSNDPPTAVLSGLASRLASARSCAGPQCP